VWDESTRPVAPAALEGFVYPRRAKAIGQHLVDVHDHLRRELAQVRDILEQVKAGAVSAAAARSALHDTAMRQNDWTLGAFCASYCTLVSQHHAIEDQSVFPHLRRAEAGLAPVIDRLEEEHVVIHEVVEGVDKALVDLIQKPGDFTEVQEAIDLLTDALLSHLAYEEQQIVEPLSRYGFYTGQL
jgi:hemerythrin-like domain-containing protein